MAYYPPPPHGYGCPPVIQHSAYPPGPTAYDQGYYNLAGYAAPPPSAYSGYPSGPPPSKKQKNNSGSAHYAQTAYPASISPPPPPPGPGYGYPSAYPQAFYPPAALSVLPPPPGWIPPPPPGWTGAVPPPPLYATAYPPGPYPPQSYPPTEHRSSHTPHGGSHIQEQKPAAGFPRSKQWHNPKGPYGQAARATSTAASATSQSSPKAVQTPREHSAGPTPPTERSASISHAPRTTSRGSIAHTRISSDDLHLDDDDYFCKEYEDINPALSLGEVVWKSGVPVGRAMPASWKKAKEWSDMIPLIQIEIKKEQSRSQYVTTKENEEKECRPARETKDWPKMKDDPIFADLSKGGKLISHQEAMVNRAKSAQPTVDVDAEEGEIAGAIQYDFSTSEDYDVKFGSSPPGHHPPQFGRIMSSHSLIPNSADIPLPGIEDQGEPFLPLPQSDAQDDLIESIIRAAEAKATASVPVKRQLPGHPSTTQSVPQLKANIIPDLTLPQKPPRGLKRSRSRSKSPERKLMKALPKPPEFEKDQTQEDILAALGVTGSPKPVYITPGPAYMAPPPEASAASKNRPHVLPPPPPPPPPPSRLDSIAEDADDGNPWTAGAGRAATPGSVTSQHTMVGSDFMEDDTEATPKAGKNLKRQRDEPEEVKLVKLLPQDGATPRGNRQRAPRIHEAFSRRW